MKAVRCHRFAAIESTPPAAENDDRAASARKRRPSFRPRKAGPLALRDCLSLDVLPYPRPQSSKGENTIVVIQTEYAGIQYPDALQARGLYQVRPKLPYVPGMDVVGTVLEIIPPKSKATSAAATTSFRIRPGDRVMATLLESGGTGGLAEVVMAPLKHVYRLPITAATTKKRNAHSAAAAFANVGRNYFAAYHSLVEVGRIHPQRQNNYSSKSSPIVLVTGASGGVGMATIELAKAMGCTVVAGVGSPQKIGGPKSVGADVVLCYGRTKAERRAFRKKVAQFCRNRGSPKGVDLVVDVVMGDLFNDALVGCLKPLGTIALVGFAAGQRPIKPGLLLVKEARVAGSLWSSVASEASEDDSSNRYRRMVETILGYLADGSIKGRVDRIVPLSEFIQAFEIFENNQGRGNTVVSFVDDNDARRGGNRSLL